MTTEQRAATASAARQAARALGTQLDPSRLVLPGPAMTQEVKLWNGEVHHQPALLVRCGSVADVQASVRAARNSGLPLSVRGGGHDWAGRAIRDGGLVIDLTRMRRVEVENRVAVAQGGATSADLAAAADPLGLSAATGSVGAVGLVGFATGGGYGPLNGRVGLASDNILGAEVVLADGRLVFTDADHEPELYWALRGGGGNFGVVTSLRVRLHSIHTVLAGMVLFPLAQAPQVLGKYAALLEGAPDEFTAQVDLMTSPGGQPAVHIAPVWSGAPEAGQPLMDAVRRLGTPLQAKLGPMRYKAMLALSAAGVRDGLGYAQPTRSVAGLTPELIALLASAGAALPSPHSMISLWHFHGASTRVPVQSTAFGVRREHHVVDILAAWEPGEDGHSQSAWAADVWTALASHSLPGGYANLLAPDRHDQIDSAYGPNAARLLAAKQRYDPDGVFTAIPLPTSAAEFTPPGSTPSTQGQG